MERTRESSPAIALLILAATIAIMLLMTAWAWNKVPAGQLVPTHWGFNGQADAYGGKAEALLALPIIAAVTSVVLGGLIWLFLRGQGTIPSRSIALLSAGVMILFITGQLQIVLSSVGRPAPILSIMPFGLAAAFALVGLGLEGVPPNGIMGARTPWTYASDVSWRKSQRLACRAFLVVALLTALGAFLPNASWFFALFMVALLGASVVVIVYSYIFWKQDPDRRPPSWWGPRRPAGP